MFESTTIWLLWLASTWILSNIILGIIDGYKSIDRVVINKIEVKLDEIIHRVKEEKQGDMIYWFDLDDGEFLAQGRTQDEIIQIVKARFPHHMFFLANDTYVGSPRWTVTEIPPEILSKNSQ